MSFTSDLLDALAPMLYADAVATAPVEHFPFSYGLGLPFELIDETVDSFIPTVFNDPVVLGPLTTYLSGLSLPFELVETWASDTDDHVGWSLLLDVDRCPLEALPWLGQLVGITVDQRLNENDQRSQIRNLTTWKRGTPGAIMNAPLPFLTGTKTVILRERYDGSGNDAPYFMELITLTSETADPALVESMVRAQKAAGITLTYATISGQDLQHIKDNYATLQDVKNTYLTLEGVKSDQAGV